MISPGLLGCPWKESALTEPAVGQPRETFHLDNLRCSGVPGTRDRLLRSGPALDPQPVSVAAPLSAGSRGQAVRSRRARPARQMTTRRRPQATSRACCTDHSRQRATRRSHAESAKSMRERSTTRSRRPGPPRTPMRNAVEESALSNPQLGTPMRLQPAETESPSRQHSLIDPSAAPSLVVSTHLRCSPRPGVIRSARRDRGSRFGSFQWGNGCRPGT